MKPIHSLTPLAAFLLMIQTPAGVLNAAVPNSVQYQARVAANGVNVDGTGDFKFLIFEDGDANQTNGNETARWSNHETGPRDMAEPASAVSLPVVRGHFSVPLGDSNVVNMRPFPSSLEPSPGTALYLRVWFDDGRNGFQQLNPDSPLNATFFALKAGSADIATAVPSGAISSAMLADGSVSPSKLAPSHQDGSSSLAAAVGNGGGTAQVTFDTPFEVPPTVQIANSSLAPQNITATGFSLAVPPNHIVVSGTKGSYPTMQVVNGHPAIAWRDDVNNRLLYSRASNPQGNAWQPPVILATGSGNIFPGHSVSMRIVNGRPAVACLTVVNATVELQFLRANDAGGGTWGGAQTVDTILPNPVGGCEMEVVDGFPAVAYTDAEAGDLYFVRATDASGAGWGNRTLLGSTLSGFPPQYGPPALEIVNGHPAVASALKLGHIYYGRATDATGLGGWQTLNPASDQAPSDWIDLRVVDGHPAIAFHSQSHDALHLLRSDNATGIGSSWEFTDAAFAAFYRGVSLDLEGGVPVLAYVSSTSLKRVTAEDAPGTSWDAAVDVDTSVITNAAEGRGPSLVSIGGKLFAAYQGSGRILFGALESIPNLLSYEAFLTSPVQAASVAPGTISREEFAPGIFGTDVTTGFLSAFASGDGSTALGQNTVAMGGGATATGRSAVAMGEGVRALGAKAFASGDQTEAAGRASFAAGFLSESSGDYSTAFGHGTVAPTAYEFALGRFNTQHVSDLQFSRNSWIFEDRAFVIGNGFNDANRSDLLSVFKDGRVVISNDIEFNQPKVVHHNVPAVAINVRGTANSFVAGVGFVIIRDYSFLDSPLHLPHGAVIQSISLYYSDNEGGADMSSNGCQLYSRLLTSADFYPELVVSTAGISTSGASPTVLVASGANPDPGLAVIDHENRYYWLYQEVLPNGTPTNDELRIYGAKVVYEQTTVTP